jgi:hypothetical protein
VAQWALDRGAWDRGPRSRLPLLEMSRRLRSRELPVRRIRAPG